MAAMKMSTSAMLGGVQASTTGLNKLSGSAGGPSTPPNLTTTTSPAERVRCQAAKGHDAQPGAKAVQTVSKAASAGEKWTGGLKDVHLDCPVELLWEYCADWAHWDRFIPSDPDFRLVVVQMEGENRKAGCKRYAELAKGNWTCERLLAIDNENHYFSYTMEENVFCGGVVNLVCKVQFRGTSDGKTVLEYWNYEVDPLTNMTREEFAAFYTGFLSQKLVKGMEAAAQKLSTKWTGGLEPMHLDCPVEVVWDLAADWANWDRFYPSSPDFPMVSKLLEGENRKVGCKRYAEVAKGNWTSERLLSIDNVYHYFSYNMEENVFCGGLVNYVGRVSFRGTSDGKTVLEYWNYEVDPLTNMTREAFTAFIGGFLSQKLVRGMEAAAKKLAPERWTGGLEPMKLDCPVDVLWDLAADWANWDRFYPSGPDFPMVSKQLEGVNRNVGCKRYAEVAKGAWTTERLLAIDNANHYFSYNMEENVFCGGLRNYVGKVKFHGTSDGKTMLEYWSYEVDPLTNMGREEFSKFIAGFLGQKLVKGMEAAAHKLAAENNKHTTHAHHRHGHHNRH